MALATLKYTGDPYFSLANPEAKGEHHRACPTSFSALCAIQTFTHLRKTIVGHTFNSSTQKAKAEGLT